MVTEETPLQRYLRKNAAASGDAPGPQSAAESAAESAATPAAPRAEAAISDGPSVAPLAESASELSNVAGAAELEVVPPGIEEKPARVGARLVALILDQMIFSFVTTPVVALLTLSQVPWQEMLMRGDFLHLAQTLAGLTAFATAIDLFFAFFYYGWFYKHKGATVGKLIVSVSLVDYETGQKIGYLRAFVRDAILRRYVSLAFTFGIGCLIAVFRDDGRALHDLICSTQVVCRSKKSS